MIRIKVDGKIYTLKFTTLSIIKAEKQLGKSVWSIFGADTISQDDAEIIKNGNKKFSITNFRLGDFFVLFWASMSKFHKDIDLNTGLDIADSWFEQEGLDEDGNARNSANFMQLITKLVTDSSVMNTHEIKSLEPNTPEFMSAKGDSEIKK